MMPLVPSWAPNVHPMLVHFPIALIFTSVAMDVLAYVVPGKARAIAWDVAAVLGVLGTLAAVAAYVTGRAASFTVQTPGMAQALVQTHWTWAFWTLWYFGAMSALRLALLLTGHVRGPRVTAVMVVGGLIGLGLLFETADHGAELVFRHGVGVGVLPGAPQ